MCHRLAALLLLLAPVVAIADVPGRPAQPIRVHDLATLSPGEAERLVGRVALYRIEVDSRAEDYEGRILVDCTSPDWIHRTVRLVPPAEVHETLTVRATLHIITHPARWGFPELVEYRLPDAEVR